MKPDKLKSLEKSISQYSPVSIIKTSMVLWLNAFLIQYLLNINAPRVFYELPFSNPKKPMPPDVRKWWDKIADKNWVNIFNPAIDTLDYIYDACPENTPYALKILIDCVGEILGSHVGENIHFGCELFPKISDNRKEAAAYYTREPTAEFLSTLPLEKMICRKKNGWIRIFLKSVV